MKKILTFLVSAILCVSFFGCDDTKEPTIDEQIIAECGLETINKDITLADIEKIYGTDYTYEDSYGRPRYTYSMNTDLFGMESERAFTFDTNGNLTHYDYIIGRIPDGNTPYSEKELTEVFNKVYNAFSTEYSLEDNSSYTEDFKIQNLIGAYRFDTPCGEVLYQGGTDLWDIEGINMIAINVEYEN